MIEPIGRGGMAVVYLVEHPTLCKRFAVKVRSVELAANLEAAVPPEPPARASR